MRRHVIGLCCLVVLAIAFATEPLAAASPIAAPAEPAPAVRAQISETYAKLPLSFEANAGQVSPEVDFLCRGAGMTLFLSGGEAVLSLRGAEGSQAAVVRMEPVGVAQHPRGIGLEPQITKTNYFIGNDPQQWHTDIANFGQVRYRDVYPGIDLVYRGNQRRLEYDLVVAPGADPQQIHFAFSGADSIHLDPLGGLILHTAAGDLEQPAPTVYQETGEGRERVEGRYVLLASQDTKHAEGDLRREVGFAIGRYDRAQPLIIDPVIVYSTFLGGSGTDAARGVAVDGAGDAYITGTTSSATFPGVSGSSIQPANGGGFDAFVTKLNAAGTAIVYSTFLGGSGDDVGRGIAVDGGGNAYITGFTSSATLPGVSGSSIQPAYGGGTFDAFVTKINPAGTAIIYSTFLGGSGDDSALGIAVDGGGNAYVTGATTSTTFPGVTGTSIQPANAGSDDVFVTKINAAGTAIVYSTFLGGSGSDVGEGIAVDGSGNAYVTGLTISTTFPGVTAGSIQPANDGANDAFVTKLNAAGSKIVYSTFLGGSGNDQGRAIAVDGSGNAYITGFTASATFPGVSGSSIQPVHGADGGANDAFVTKINTAGTAIVYSTFLGGSGDDQGYGIAVDGTGNAYVTGFTASATFPGVSGSSLQPAYGGGANDAFVTKLNAAGAAIVYSTFLGGSGDDQGYGIAVDGGGNAYVAGLTTSATFPGVSGSSIQPVHGADGGDNDAFVTKIAGGCAPSGTSLCVDDQPGDSRWQISVHYSTSQGGGLSGDGHAIPLASLGVTHGGLFWFFSGDNPEMLIKVLNACSFNHKFWVYYSAGTNVGLLTAVRDTFTGITKSYTNPDLTAAPPVQDAAAFDCPTSSADLASEAVATPGGQPAAPPLLPAKVSEAVADDQTTALDKTVFGCVSDATTLCISDRPGDQRFKVKLHYQTSQGGGLSGDGQAIPLSSLGVNRGGVFWFFGADNPEMLIKVLNACSFNNKFWVYYSAGTNVGLTVTITDTANGHFVTYTNPDLHPAPPVQDVNALSCP